MRLQALSTLLPALTLGSLLPSPQSIFSNLQDEQTTNRIPTVHESAVQARRVLHLETIGTLSTIFPSSSSSQDLSTLENRPSGLGGTPIGLMDYYADCEPPSGNPTILAITIATSFKNVASGSNITLSLRWHPPNPKHFYSAANMPRFSLIGYLEDIPEEEVIRHALPGCFVRRHPDAAAWLPGNRIHESKWVRLVVREVYWIGGFGDRNYIGWIPVEEWQSVTKEEIDDCTLPGERQPWAWESWFGRAWEL